MAGWYIRSRPRAEANDRVAGFGSSAASVGRFIKQTRWTIACDVFQFRRRVQMIAARLPRGARNEVPSCFSGFHRRDTLNEMARAILHCNEPRKQLVVQRFFRNDHQRIAAARSRRLYEPLLHVWRRAVFFTCSELLDEVLSKRLTVFVRGVPAHNQAIVKPRLQRWTHGLPHRQPALQSAGMQQQRQSTAFGIPQAVVDLEERVFDGLALFKQLDVAPDPVARHRRREDHVDPQQVRGHDGPGRKDRGDVRGSQQQGPEQDHCRSSREVVANRATPSMGLRIRKSNAASP
jgi:hypothetical protein